MDGSDYLKYMTERVVKRMERPKEERKSRTARSKELWLTKWFGMAPMGLMIWWGGHAERKQNAPRGASN